MRNRESARSPARPAAVYAAGDPRGAGQARVIPVGAKLRKVGNAVLGYELPRQSRSPASPASKIKRIRLAEIERLIASRHLSCGKLVHMEGAEEAYVRASAALFPSTVSAAGWAARFAPGLTGAELLAIIEEARRFGDVASADEVAKLLGVSWSEREQLALRTIGAAELSADERKARAAQRRRAKERLRKERKRRAEGVRAREDYERRSAAREAERAGVSVRTVYRWRAEKPKGGPVAGAECHRCVRTSKKREDMRTDL